MAAAFSSSHGVFPSEAGCAATPGITNGICQSPKVESLLQAFSSEIQEKTRGQDRLKGKDSSSQSGQKQIQLQNTVLLCDLLTKMYLHKSYMLALLVMLLLQLPIPMSYPATALKWVFQIMQQPTVLGFS
ncbi:hypothetical protein OIU76_005022 [Salix suchowensis]|nr:hypothetical protein OIU76_005022 [Salix suchowensis]